MHDLALRINLEEAAREKGAAIEAAVEGTKPIDIAVVVHIDDTQHLVPFLTASLGNFLQTLIAKFLEVLFCLLDADEGTGHTHVDLFAALCLEAHSCSCVLALHLEVLTLLAFICC